MRSLVLRAVVPVGIVEDFPTVAIGAGVGVEVGILRRQRLRIHKSVIQISEVRSIGQVHR